MPWKLAERFGEIAKRRMRLFFGGDAVRQAMPLSGAKKA
jgi:hypothetical protein